MTEYKLITLCRRNGEVADHCVYSRIQSNSDKVAISELMRRAWDNLHWYDEIDCIIERAGVVIHRQTIPDFTEKQMQRKRDDIFRSIFE